MTPKAHRASGVISVYRPMDLGFKIFWAMVFMMGTIVWIFTLYGIVCFAMDFHLIP